MSPKLFIMPTRYGAVRRVWLGLAAVAMFIFTGCNGDARATAEAEIAKSFNTSASPRIVVENFNGKIEVNAGPTNQVSVQVVRRASGRTQIEAETELEKVNVTLQQKNSTIRVTAERADQFTAGNSSATIQVIVPVGSRLDLHTDNDDVIVNGVNGDLRLATANGNLKISGGHGQLTLHAANGEIQVEANEAVVNADSANGNVIFKGTLADTEQFFGTDNGSIEITLPAGTDFRLSAETHNGQVLSDFPIIESSTSATGKTLKGTVGENPTLSITAKSSNGSIAIYRG